MRARFNRLEGALLLAGVLLLALALAGPPVSLPGHAHPFADPRTLWGIPHALDVLSNLPFAVAGVVGAWLLWRLPPGALSNMERAMAALFCAGLVLTAAGSAWYHLQPDDTGLALDRYAMSVAFAGLLGLAAAGRVSQRAGAALGLAVLVLAPLAVHAWARSGDLLPWAVVQFGGMAAVLGFACLRPLPGTLPVRWGLVLAAYALAKWLEVQDHAIFELTGRAVSGHTLKHLVAALAALPVLAALGHRARSRQNAAGIALAPELAARRARRA